MEENALTVVNPGHQLVVVYSLSTTLPTRTFSRPVRTLAVSSSDTVWAILHLHTTDKVKTRQR